MDGVEKVTGAAEYAGDIRLPGMLYARILRPPAHGATLTRVDTSGAEAMPGVTVVNEDGMVAVLAADPETGGAGPGGHRGRVRRTGPDGGHREHLPAPGGRRRPIRTLRNRREIWRRAAGPRPRPSSHLLQQLRGPCSHGAAHSCGGDQGRKGHGVDFHPDALRGPAERGPGHRVRARERPDHDPLRGWRIRRKGGWGAGRGGGPAWPRSRASPCRWPGPGPRSSSTTPSGRPPPSRSPREWTRTGKLTLWDYQVYGAGSRAAEVFYDVPNKSVRVYGEWGRAPAGHAPLRRGSVAGTRRPTATGSRRSSRSTSWLRPPAWIRWNSGS